MPTNTDETVSIQMWVERTCEFDGPSFANCFYEIMLVHKLLLSGITEDSNGLQALFAFFLSWHDYFNKSHDPGSQLFKVREAGESIKRKKRSNIGCTSVTRETFASVN